jgi:predicted nucleic acid-binding protein
MICLDAGFVASAFLPEGDASVYAANRIAQWRAKGIEFVAPDLWAYEAVSIVFKAHGPVVLAEMLRFPVTLIRPISYERAYDLAMTYHLPAPYDAHYLAVAEAEGVEFWTGDKRLYDRVHAGLPWVHCLGEES